MISSIIINYNQGKFFKAAYRSILNQTIRPNEIIVVDDASTDNSVDIIENVIDSYRNSPKFIETKLIQHDINAGASQSRNTGIQNSNNNILAFLDGDDVYYPEKIEKSLPYLDDPFVKMVYSDYDVKLENGNVIREYKNTFHTGLMKKICLPNSNSLIKKDIFTEVGVFDTSIQGAEDYEMWMRIGSRGMIIHIPEALFCYRMHGGNFTVANRDQVIQNTNTLLGRYNA